MVDEIIIRVYADKLEEILTNAKDLAEIRSYPQQAKQKLLFGLVTHYEIKYKEDADFERQVFATVKRLEDLGINFLLKLPLTGRYNFSYPETVYDFMVKQDKNPLFLSAYRRKLEMFNKLNLDINLPDSEGFTSLDYAIDHCNRTIIPCFQAAGAIAHDSTATSMVMYQRPVWNKSTVSFAYTSIIGIPNIYVADLDTLSVESTILFLDLVSRQLPLIPADDLQTMTTSLLTDITNFRDSYLTDESHWRDRNKRKENFKRLNALINSPWIDLTQKSATNPGFNPLEDYTALDVAMNNNSGRHIFHTPEARVIIKRGAAHFIRERFNRVANVVLNLKNNSKASASGSLPRDLISLIYAYIGWRDLATLTVRDTKKTWIGLGGEGHVNKNTGLPNSIHFCDAAAAIYMQDNGFYAPSKLVSSVASTCACINTSVNENTSAYYASTSVNENTSTNTATSTWRDPENAVNLSGSLIKLEHEISAMKEYVEWIRQDDREQTEAQAKSSQNDPNQKTIKDENALAAERNLQEQEQQRFQSAMHFVFPARQQPTAADSNTASTANAIESTKTKTSEPL